MTDNKNYEINGKNRLIAIVVLAAILAVMLFSSCYIIKEADHDCSGTSCPVCAVIQQCENNLGQIGMGQIAIIAVAAAFCFLYQAIASIHAVVSAETPITRKVRLND